MPMVMDANEDDKALGLGDGSPRAAAAYERRKEDEREPEGSWKALDDAASDDGSIEIEVENTWDESLAQ